MYSVLFATMLNYALCRTAFFCMRGSQFEGDGEQTFMNVFLF